MQYSDLMGLSAMERQEAKDNAREIIVRGQGNKPVREHYQSQYVSRYPLWLTLTISVLCLVALVAAFTISATHLNDIGKSTIARTIDHEASIGSVGISVVILAEVSALVFSLALALANDKPSRYAMYGGMMASTAIALTGNIEHANPVTIFGWILAVIPALVVLGLGYTLKMQALDAIKDRYTARREYDLAMVGYNKSIAAPESSPKWTQVYASAIRDMLIKVNRKGRGRNERIMVMNGMDNADWKRLVAQEMTNDNWFTDDEMLATDVVSEGKVGIVDNFLELAQTSLPLPIKVRYPAA